MGGKDRAKRRVLDLDIDGVAVGLTRDGIAVRAQRSLTDEEMGRIERAARDVSVDFAEIGTVVPQLRYRGALYRRSTDRRPTPTPKGIGPIVTALDMLESEIAGLSASCRNAYDDLSRGSQIDDHFTDMRQRLDHIRDDLLPAIEWGWEAYRDGRTINAAAIMAAAGRTAMTGDFFNLSEGTNQIVITPADADALGDFEEDLADLTLDENRVWMEIFRDVGMNVAYRWLRPSDVGAPAEAELIAEVDPEVGYRGPAFIYIGRDPLSDLRRGRIVFERWEESGRRTATIKHCRKDDIDPHHELDVEDQRFCLYSNDGKKLLGRHKTKQDARRQQRSRSRRAMLRMAVIKDCRKKDIDHNRPLAEQRVCLYTKDGKRLLGRHPDKEAAQRQERAIHSRKGSRRRAMKKEEAPRMIRHGGRLWERVDSRIAVTIHGVKRFKGEKDLILELEKWGDPEKVKTGKVFWHAGEDKYLLVPGDVAEGELALSLAKDDTAKAKEIGSQLEYVSLEKLKGMVEDMDAEYRSSVKWHYVDNVYTRRRYRQQYERPDDTKEGSMRKRDRSRRRLGKKWKGLPRGWTKESLEQFWNSMGGDVSACIKELEDNPEIDDPGAFCASIKDRLTGTTYWRGGPGKQTKGSGPPRLISVRGQVYERVDD